MDESIGIFAVAITLIGIVLWVSYAMIKSDRAEREEIKRLEEEEKRKRQEEEEERLRQAEEERKRNTMCCICGHCSMGNIVCDNCYDRTEPIKKELPVNKIKNYELLTKFYQETIDKAIFASTKIDREFQCIRLIAIADLLKIKYYILDIEKDTLIFLKELSAEGYQISDAFIAKYASKDRSYKSTDTDDEDNEETESNDYRNKHDKPYRCADGDYVRSKAEREIDDFFFKNRIWHEYEAEYVNSETRQKYYPDFYLPDYTLYIEYFGLATDEYIEKRDQKIKMYRSDSSINFDYLTYEDDNNIYDKLKDICRKHNIPFK